MAHLLYSPHATSADNEAGLASGHADPPLTQEGERRARDLRDHYTSAPVDVCYCSDLQRAVHTAQILFGERGIPIVTDRRLREIDFGSMTQGPRDEVHAEMPSRITRPFPEGQRLLDVVRGVGDVLAEVLRADAGHIVVIGHAATKLALEWWTTRRGLAEIVGGPWPWLEVPIFRYEIDELGLRRRAADLDAEDEHRTTRGTST